MQQQQRNCISNTFSIFCIFYTNIPPKMLRKITIFARLRVTYSQAISWRTTLVILQYSPSIGVHGVMFAFGSAYLVLFRSTLKYLKITSTMRPISDETLPKMAPQSENHQIYTQNAALSTSQDTKEYKKL